MFGKISLFLPNLETAGAERVTVFLANGLAQRRIPVDVVLVKAKGGFLADLREEVHVVDLKSARTLRAIPRLAYYMRKQRPAVVISALDHVNAAAIIAGRLSCTATSVITAVHTSRAAAAQHGPGIRGVLSRFCLNWFYRRARAIVCVSHGVAEDMIRIAGVGRQRVRVIYNPVLHPRIQEFARQPVEHPWFGTPGQSEAGHSRILLGVGRLTPQKDFPTLLRALKLVRQGHDVRLVILGEGEERPHLESLVKELSLESCVSMPGVVKNPYAYMARADQFVLSSAWEALPTVLIEALAAGAPVVATDCVSGPREILQDGRYGVLTPVGDVTALAEAVSATLSAPRRRTARRSPSPVYDRLCRGTVLPADRGSDA